MLLFDPVRNAVVPSRELNLVDMIDGYAVVENSDGSTFAIELATLKAKPIQEVSGLLERLPLVEAGEPVEVDLRGEDNDTTSTLTEGIDDPHILKAIFVAGAGGSGKGKISAAMFAGTGLKIIDQDKHLEKFMQAAKVPLSMVGVRYDLLKKAQKLKGAEIRQYGSRRLGLVIDSTGWEYDRIAKPAKKLRNLGYDIFMVFVSTSLETAQRRNEKRGEEGGRDVPPSFISTAHAGAHSNIPAFRKLFGGANVTVIRNDKDMSDADWTAKAVPKLKKLAARILKAPIKNQLGVRWLEHQKDGEPEATPSDWPIDPPEPVKQWTLPAE